MNSVGTDVSKGKSMVAVMRQFGEVVAEPVEYSHTIDGLKELVAFLKSIDGEIKVVMEHTGKYYEPIAQELYNSGFFVSVVNAVLIHNYGNNTIRKVKTDKKDAVKIVNYALSNWSNLIRYRPDEDVRQLLKTYNRQYNKYVNMKVSLINNLMSITEQTFPDVRRLFTSPPRRKDGHEKWVDFLGKFWHCRYISGMTETNFYERYTKWCRKNGYLTSKTKAAKIYAAANEHVGVLPENESTKLLITQSVAQLNSICETLTVIRTEMHMLSTQLPEYPVVMAMCGVGETLGPQLMAEIGDVTRFHRKQSLVAFAGVDVPPYQSGKYESKHRGISKKGPPLLRKSLFQVMACLLQTSPAEDKVYQFLDKKRREGKHFYVYMMAGTNKFLRIYYARVIEYLRASEISV